MEGRVDENNRSLFSNPFVSTGSVNPSEHTQPLPLHSPSFNPGYGTIYQALPAHKQLTALLKSLLVPQTVKEKCSSSPPDKNTTHTQLCPCFHPVHLGGRREQVSIMDSLLLFFMQTYSNLASAYYHVCIGYRNWKCCFCLFTFFASLRLLSFVCFCFVLTTVHVLNALESNTAYSRQVVFVLWSCLRAARERRGVREGECSGCRGKRRLCLMRSHPGNLVTPPTQLHPAFPIFPLGPV